MSIQELAAVIVATVGGNTVILLSVWKLSEKLIDQRLKQQQSVFEHTLNKAHSLFSSRKQIFCERQEEAFAHTYSLLMDCRRKLLFLGQATDLQAFDKLKIAYEAFQNDATLYFLGKCFYFSAELLESTQRLFMLYNEIVNLYGRGQNLQHHGAQYGIDLDTIKDDKAEVDRLLKTIRDSLHNTLSADEM